MEKYQALHDLELALRRWYRATDTPFPEIGFVLIGISFMSTDLQYLGIDPNRSIDWTAFFARVIENLHAGRGVIQPVSEVIFPSQR